MANVPILADVDLSTLIYLIAVVIWVLGNVFKAKKKQGSPSRPQPSRPPRADESDAERELREFLETLAGGRPTEESGEQPQPVSTPAPTLRRKPAKPARATPSPPPPVRRPPATPDFVPEPDLVKIMKELADQQPTRGGTSMGTAFATALRSRGTQFKLPEVRLAAMKQATSGLHPIPATPLLQRRELASRTSLRKLVAAKIILGEPKAFERPDAAPAGLR